MNAVTRKNFLPILAAVGALLAGLPDARATASTASAAPSAGAAVPEQGSYYDRANQNISLQYAYARAKVDYLDNLKRNDPGKLKGELGEFCHSTESGSKCLDRYKRIEGLRFLKIAAALGRNSQSAAELAAGGGAVSKAPKSPFHAGEITFGVPADARKPVIPEIPTLSELDREYRRQGLGRRDGQELARQMGEYLRELEPEADPSNPERNDYAEYQPVPRDPERPDLGFYYVRKPGSAADPGQVRRAGEARRELQNELKGYGQAQFSTPPRSLDPPDAGSLAAYDHAQSKMIEEAERFLRDDASGSRPGVIEFHPRELNGGPANPAGGERRIAQDAAAGAKRDTFVTVNPENEVRAEARSLAPGLVP